MPEHFELSDPHPLTADKRGDPLACEAFKTCSFGQCLIAKPLLAVPNNRLC